MQPPRVFELTRMRSRAEAGGKTLFFRTEGLGRRSRSLFFQPDDVPDFDGETAWFRAEWVTKQGWRIACRVNRDGSPYVE